MHSFYAYKHKVSSRFLQFLLALLLCICACTNTACAGISASGEDSLHTSNAAPSAQADTTGASSNEDSGSQAFSSDANLEDADASAVSSEQNASGESDTSNATSASGYATSSQTSASFSLSSVPAYTGSPSVEINGNVPFFSQDEINKGAHEDYTQLDSLGRCGVACMVVSTSTMPTGKRGSIGMIKPSGWRTVRYDWVDGKYLFNRCHLLGYQLSGENANELNLITGTRSMNTEGMLPYENKIAQYVKSNAAQVLYRVTPVFYEDNLVASGVLMEAYSLDDEGKSLQFCVFCYNVEPGVSIDYATGESWGSDAGASGETGAVAGIGL